MKPSFSAWSPYDEEDNEPFKTKILRKGIGIIEMDQYDDHVEMWCPHCKAAGFRVKLGPKILMPNEVRQPDYDQWLECPDCCEIVAAYVVEHDATIIVDDIPTVETPFENTTEIIGAHAKRTSAAGKKAAAIRKRPTHKDKEIQREIDQHGFDAVNIIYDSSGL